MGKWKFLPQISCLMDVIKRVFVTTFLVLEALMSASLVYVYPCG
jgi:hypothetical protein